MRDLTPRHLLAPTLGAGVLMALYLLLRPYGDAGSTTEAAHAFASTRWIVAHLCGALAVASIGRLGLRVADLYPSRSARLARWSGLTGAVLVLPYYGAETFGLYAIGARALIDPAAFDLVDQVRNQPVALTMFALGLVLVAVAGIAVALAWSGARRSVAGSRAAWPLGVLIALFTPQFYLPPAGRIGYGVVFLAAAVVLVVALVRAERPATRRPDPVAAS